MNQILSTPNSNDINQEEKANKNNDRNRKKYKFLFLISISFLFGFSFIYYFYYNYYLNNNLLNNISDNYNIADLYNNYSAKKTTYSYKGENFNIIGRIIIDKIKIDYPIISDISDELLKIAPCRFYGPLPNENGNLCIAGHNYNNEKFFSKLNNLNLGDSIKIYDTDSNFLEYIIVEKKEVNSNDTLSVIKNNNINKQITLVTCNNSNNKRIIIKAISL